MGLSPADHTIIVLIFGVILEILFVSWILNRYSNPRKTQYFVSFIVWFGWFFSFAIVFFIPMDIAASRHEACHTSDAETALELDCSEPTVELETKGMRVVWLTLYWTIYVMCWAVYPISQSYVVAAHFTIHEKFVYSLKQNLILYSVMGFVGVVFGGWLLAYSSITLTTLTAVAMAASNVYGLFLLFCLLSYGLVEIPKKLWRQRNRTMILRAMQFQAVGQLEELEKSKEELETTLKLVKAYQDAVGLDSSFKPFMDTILKKVPPQYHDLLGGSGSVDMSYDSFVNLHYRVIYATMNYERTRCLYEQLLKGAYELEDKIKSKNAADRRMKWSFKERTDLRPFMQHLYRAEWYWYTYCECPAMVFAAFLCGALSICVVWSETFFWIATVPHWEKWHLSIFYWLLNGISANQFFQWLMVFAPCCYIAFCAFWSMFQLRILNYYRLLPHQQTDPNSILFAAYYICRLTAPMIYNFLLMIDDKESAYRKVMNVIDLIPIMGNLANAYLPILLVILCAMNVFNVWTKLLGACCIKRFRKFSYDEEFTDERIDQGKDIIATERSLRERGLGLSIDQENGSPLRKQKKSMFELPALTSKFSFWRKKTTKEDKIELLERRGKADV
jgi:hypothetical protein